MPHQLDPGLRIPHGSCLGTLDLDSPSAKLLFTWDDGGVLDMPIDEDAPQFCSPWEETAVLSLFARSFLEKKKTYSTLFSLTQQLQKHGRGYYIHSSR